MKGISLAIMLLVLVCSVESQTPEAVGSELDPNSIKPSDIKIEQKKIYEGSSDHASNAGGEYLSEEEAREQMKLADAGIDFSTLAAKNESSGAANVVDSINQPGYPGDTEERNIEELESTLAKRQVEQEQQQLPQWLRAEDEQNPNVQVPNLLEEFHITLADSESHWLVLDSTNKTDSDNRIYLEFFVYTLGDNNQYAVPNRPAEATHLLLSMAPNANPNTGMKKRIYAHARTDVPLRPIYHMHFTNNYDRQIYVICRVEFMKKLINPVGQQHLDPSTTKLSAVAEAFEKHKVTYKWDMGFKEQAQSHQSTFLWLTALELFMILLTSVLQIACLKRLIDNRAIV